MLDTLRGIAAFSVVLYHWNHFTLPGQSNPFSSVLWLIYLIGPFAVPVFFCLSGFVFFWLYAKKIHENETKVSQFTILRLSRLYPLHFVTLIIVSVLQFIYMIRYSQFYIYNENSAYYFSLNILFISGWLSKVFSFNGPSWSVSVEIFLYITFFIFARTFGVRALPTLMAIGVGFLLLPINSNLSGGVILFYAGGLSLMGYQKCHDRFPVSGIIIGIVISTSVLLLYVFERKTSIGLQTLHQLLPTIPKLNIVYQISRDSIFAALCFAPIIMALALIERSHPYGRSIAWLGDISYSMYLIHFPLQLAFILITDRLGLTRGVYYLPVTLILYICVLIPLSLMSYHWFERPVMGLFRRHRATRIVSTPDVHPMNDVDTTRLHP